MLARFTLDARARLADWDREGRERVVYVSPETDWGDGVAWSTEFRASWGGSRPGAGAPAACHCPAGEGVRNGAKGVVTGGKSGLQANGDKAIANKIARAALVTAW